MKHGRTVFQLEAGPEFIMQGIGVIAHDIETTAFERPIRPERGDDDVSAQFLPPAIPDGRKPFFAGVW